MQGWQLADAWGTGGGKGYDQGWQLADPWDWQIVDTGGKAAGMAARSDQGLAACRRFVEVWKYDMQIEVNNNTSSF